MKISYYEVSAFASHPFGGNPAGVCLLPQWLENATLQNIAAQNNLSETAFVVGQGDDFELRWFAPEMEIDLCGHATLAAAHVLFSERNVAAKILRFHSGSGVLTVTRAHGRLVLDFPSRPAAPCKPTDQLLRALGRRPELIMKSRDFMAVFATEADVRALRPDVAALRKLDCLGVIVTGPGENCDFVSRFFVPAAGVPEDPVTGSAHCTLIPYWAERLGKTKLHAWQVSTRGGELFCDLAGDRVHIGGQAVVYLRGEIEIPD